MTKWTCSIYIMMVIYIISMNNETYDQIAIDDQTVGDALKFVKENETVKICSYNGNVFAIEAPLFVELDIIDTEPGFKGDTAQGATKPATVETGAVVYVPLFVDQVIKLKSIQEQENICQEFDMTVKKKVCKKAWKS